MTHPLGNGAEIIVRVRPRVGAFGWSRTNADGSPKMHEGIDWIAPLGTPVIAAHDGILTKTGWQRSSAGTLENDGYGQRVWLVGQRVRTIYAHLALIVPYDHLPVREGQILGFVGNTGNAYNTDPHLHFEVHLERNGAWVPVNPEWSLGIDGAAELGVPKPADPRTRA